MPHNSYPAPGPRVRAYVESTGTVWELHQLSVAQPDGVSCVKPAGVSGRWHRVPEPPYRAHVVVRDLGSLAVFL